MNEYLLAIDTTGEFGSIALIQDERVVEEIPLHSPEGFGHVLFPHLQRLLDNHALTVSDLACFASASGPGSFTGVRVGLSAVKGLAEAAGKPAMGVSNLRAIASFGERAVRAAVLDARRGEVYGGMYDSQSDPLGPEVVAKAGVGQRHSRWMPRLCPPIPRCSPLPCPGGTWYRPRGRSPEPSDGSRGRTGARERPVIRQRSMQTMYAARTRNCSGKKDEA